MSERYLLNGRSHRDSREGPAYIERDKETGYVTREYYKINGRFHREDGPAEIFRNAEGNLLTETYLLDNVIHRDPKDGPALIEHRYEHGYDGGRKLGVVESYMVYNEEYRDPQDGPCWIERDKSGKIIAEDFSPPDEAPPIDRRLSRRRRIKAKACEP